LPQTRRRREVNRRAKDASRKNLTAQAAEVGPKSGSACLRPTSAIHPCTRTNISRLVARAAKKPSELMLKIKLLPLTAYSGSTAPAPIQSRS
jgi:hypothetical protein